MIIYKFYYYFSTNLTCDPSFLLSEVQHLRFLIFLNVGGTKFKHGIIWIKDVFEYCLFLKTES